MKNNEKFLNDLENIPDRFMDEILDSEDRNAIVKRSRIQWIKPVSVAVCIAVVAALPVILLNIKPNNENIPLREETTVTSAVTTLAETTTRSTTVIITEQSSKSTLTTPYVTVTTPYTSVTTAVPVTSEIITAEKEQVSEMIQQETPQNVPETEPQNEYSETEPVSSETEKYIVADDPDRDLVMAVKPECVLEELSPYWIRGEDDSITEYKYEADFLIINAQKLPERFYGKVSDEETLINITRKIFSENIGDINGMNIVDYIEREYIIDEDTGEKIKLSRPETDDKMYYIEYYEDYDVWYITPSGRITYTKPSTDKVFISWWEWAPYLLVRGSDGKILAFSH